MNKRQTTLTSLHAEGTLSASARGARQSVTFEGNLYKRDSLYLALYGPLGITVGKLQSIPTFAQFYYVLDNTVYEGEPTRKNFMQFNIPISYNEVTTFLRGEVPGGFDGFVAQQHDKVGEELYRRQKDSTVERLVYSTADQAIVEYQVKHLDGTELMYVKCGNFAPVAGLQLAQDLFFQFPSSNSSLTIQCSAVQANLPNQKYSFPLPAAPRRKFGR